MLILIKCHVVSVKGYLILGYAILRSLITNNNPSYTLQAIAELAAFREIRRIEPEKNPTKPRSFHNKRTAARIVGFEAGSTCILVCRMQDEV